MRRLSHVRIAENYCVASSNESAKLVLNREIGNIVTFKRQVTEARDASSGHVRQLDGALERENALSGPRARTPEWSIA